MKSIGPVLLLQPGDTYKASETPPAVRRHELVLVGVRNPWAWYVSTYLAARPQMIAAIEAAQQDESKVPAFWKATREAICLTGIMANCAAVLEAGEDASALLPLAWLEEVQRRLEIGRLTAQLLRTAGRDAAQYDLVVDAIVDVDTFVDNPGLLDAVLLPRDLELDPVQREALVTELAAQEADLPSDWPRFYQTDDELADLIRYNERFLVDGMGYEPHTLPARSPIWTPPRVSGARDASAVVVPLHPG